VIDKKPPLWDQSPDNEAQSQAVMISAIEYKILVAVLIAFNIRPRQQYDNMKRPLRGVC
jgi:hypothetical protein